MKIDGREGEILAAVKVEITVGGSRALGEVENAMLQIVYQMTSLERQLRSKLDTLDSTSQRIRQGLDASSRTLNSLGEIQRTAPEVDLLICELNAYRSCLGMIARAYRISRGETVD